MNTVEYDLDTTGGMMPQIQALIAPPVNEESSRKVKRERKRELGQSYYRRHGKAVNHDYCDSCKESGNLLCCDRCPASFHLQCLDPPLDEDDLPSGEWMCHRCAVSPYDVEDDRASSCSELSSGRNSHVSDRYEAMDLDKDDFTFQESSFAALKDYDREKELAVGVALRKGRRQCTIQKKKPEQSVSREVLTSTSNNNNNGNGNNGNVTLCKSGMKAIHLEVDDKESPLQVLIKVASVMNPKQFQLPSELTCTTHLPGTRKRIRPTYRQKKSPYELDNGLVPLPAKLCFECGRSCKKAPLLRCDYCPLVFHLDCLNPPLTVMPVGRWMCPNHPEHAIDQKLLSSISLSERVKLWSNFSGKLSQDTVKIQFLKKIHRVNPPFRYKIRLPPRDRVKVPNAIKEQYKYPPPLLPRVTDLLPIPSRHDNAIMKGEDNISSTSYDHDQWLRGVVSLHCSIAHSLMEQSQAKKDLNSPCEEDGSDKDNDVECMDVDMESRINDVKTSDDMKKLVDTKDELHVKSVTPSDKNNEDKIFEAISSVTQSNNTSSTVDKNIQLVKNIPDKLIDSIERLEKFNTGDKSEIDKQSSKLKESLVASFPDGDINIQKLDIRLIKLLALERLQQLFPVESSPDHADSVEKHEKDATSKEAVSQIDVRARAIVSPLTIKAPPCYMPYRSLTIGSGADTDLCLSSYGYCNYVSGKHAAIFYDETTKHYELLNYSEHGTTVDNVLYSCDFSEKRPAASVQPNTIVASVRSIIDKARGKKRQSIIKSRPLTMNACTGQKTKSCFCKTSSSNLIGGSGAGWEGTALLHHGSYIKCGCLQFVFSIIDGSPNCYVYHGEPPVKQMRHN